MRSNYLIQYVWQNNHLNQIHANRPDASFLEAFSGRSGAALRMYNHPKVPSDVLRLKVVNAVGQRPAFSQEPQKSWGQCTRQSWKPMWRFPARHGGTNNWLVYFRENPIKVDDDWGYPYDSGNHHVMKNMLVVKCYKSMSIDLKTKHMKTSGTGSF